MAVESASDRAAFFDTDEFAAAATWNATSVNGILGDQYVNGLDGAGVGVESSHPVFTCQTSDIATAAHGQSIIINAVSYTIVGVHPDGTGLTRLILSEV